MSIALAAAIVPMPPSAVERWYSRGLYPRLQTSLTPATNLIPVALLDLAIAALVVWIVFWLVRHRPLGLWNVVLALFYTTAIFYLLFLLLWGFNYRRVRLEEKLAFDKARVTREAAVRLANESVAHVNALYTQAHAIPFRPYDLQHAALDAQRALGDRWVFSAGAPKTSLLSLYFRKAAIDGMTDPFFLEIVLNPDVLVFERPSVIAHEWGHLAGYAYESEASFFAWLTCLRGDALAQYSGWLMTYEHAVGGLSREDRQTLEPLDAGPRDDIRATQARYRRSAPAVRDAARGIYDSYLRANRVSEGIASYGEVLQLMLGTELDANGNPRRRNE